MTAEQKKEALTNALISFEFPKKYFIYGANKGKDAVFTIATMLKNGAMDTKTGFMGYNELNHYLKGYYEGKMNKLK